jgi:hypothetical protein
MSLLDAVHASTNAPVLYFDEPATVESGEGTRRYWDGGIAGYNNPVLAGVVEALANGARREDVRALSLGTSTTARPRPPNGERDERFAHAKQSFLGDVVRLALAIIDDPPDAASFIAHVTLGGALPDRDRPVVADGPVFRMCPRIGPVAIGADSWKWPEALTESTWKELLKLQLDVVADADVALIRELCDAWIAGKVPNQAIRAGRRLEAEVGHDSFATARATIREQFPVPRRP